MTDDTGQYSDPISDFPDSPSISTRASNVIKRYTSSFSINSKKSKKRRINVDISYLVASRPQTQNLITVAKDRTLCPNLDSTGTIPTSPEIENSSNRSHTPTQSLPRVKTTLPIPDISTQQILDEDEIVQDCNSFNDVHCDLTELLTSNSKQFIIEANTVPELLRSILKVIRMNLLSVGNASPGMSRSRDNACHEISKICNKFAEDCTIILNDNDPNITIHQEVENQGEMNAGMDVDEGNIPNIIDYGPNHTPGATATHIPGAGQTSLISQIIPLELTTSTFFKLSYRSQMTSKQSTNTISTQPIPETKNDMSTPTNSTNPPARKNLAQIIKDKMNSKPTELVPAPNVTLPAPISKGTEASAVRFIFRFLHGAPDDTKKRLSPLEVSRRLKGVFNDRMGLNRCRILESKWNLRGNLILIFPAHSNPSAISQMEPEIRNALGLNNSGSIFTRDTKWSKVIISGVPTGFSESNDDQVISKDELMEEVRKHKSTEKLTITQYPDWTIRPEDIRTAYGSIALPLKIPTALNSP
ncbi:hypothetical protein RHS01_09535 [Rhizoctonia solani]|uniref:Uncharacterized protein n=1 Tax=Rhizoctonia solani TaxID=456999 RepID=A0A8H7I8P9_9AGAM|nr:hypothetical protein RHS01_09535 [Rhizoctonia solani]